MLPHLARVMRPRSSPTSLATSRRSRHGQFLRSLSLYSSSSNGGHSGIPARSLAVPGTSHNASSARKMSATGLLVAAASLVAWQLTSIRSGWQWVLELGAGTGAVYLLRWYWWRINAWSEISAMASALVVSLTLRLTDPFKGSATVVSAKNGLLTIGVTTVVWLAVTFLTQPESEAVLLRFYRKVRPDVSGWRPVAALAPEVPQTHDLGRNLLDWVLGTAMVYCALFGVGKLILGAPALGIVLLIVSSACAWALYVDLSRRQWGGPEGEASKRPEVAARV